MSIRIEPTRLSECLVGREFAYLVTAGSERAHVVALRCAVIGERVTMTQAGRSTLANVASNPRVTLVWAPTEVDVENHDYSIIADGSAIVDGDVIAITVTNAVFHRPAP